MLCVHPRALNSLLYWHESSAELTDRQVWGNEEKWNPANTQWLKSQSTSSSSAGGLITSPTLLFIIFPAILDTPITAPVVWFWTYGGKDVLVIALTLGVGSVRCSVVEVPNRGVLSSLTAGCSPRSWLIRIRGQRLHCTGLHRWYALINLKT